MLQKYFKTLKNKKHLNQVLLTNQKHFLNHALLYQDNYSSFGKKWTDVLLGLVPVLMKICS